jgi:hypothetical protein
MSTDRMNTYKRFIVEVTLGIVHWNGSICPDPSRRNIRAGLGIVKFSIARVSSSCWEDFLARNALSN